MEVDFAFLCDYADSSGKLNALGVGIDTISVANVPFALPNLYFVAQLRGSSAEAGNKSLRVDIIDADGTEIAKLEGPIEVRNSEPATDGVARCVFALHNLEFPHYGDYSLHLLVENNEMKRIGFKVTPASPTLDK